MTIRLFGVAGAATAEPAILEAMRQGQIAAGPHVEAFRSAIARYLGDDRVVTYDNMSSAMTVALRLAGAGHGDVVVTSPFACLSTNAPIVAVGARPSWADVSAETGMPTVETIAEAMVPGTKAVILYHLAGYPADAAAIAQLCGSRGIALIEDCNTALGATVHGRAVGSFGDFAVFSFYPNRQVNALEGGALRCARDDDHQRAIRLRRFGIDPRRFRDQLGEIDPKVDVAEIGWSFGLNNICSAAGLSSLEGLDARLDATRANAVLLTELLAGVEGVETSSVLQGSDPAYWTLLCRVRCRDEVLATLKAQGVEASKLHHRNDTYTGFGLAACHLRGTDEWMESTLSLPCGWWLTRDQIRSLAGVIAHTVASTRCRGER